MVVGIVGAGPAGLAAAHALRDAGIAYEVLERHAAPGGIWDLENPGTPMYESAHFISSKTLSGFDGWPFADELPDYPRRDQVLAYLQAYAGPVREQIAFGADVQRATPRATGGWTVQLADGGERSYDHLVVANGHQWTPRIPELPGEFAGTQMHSREYREPSVFAGKRVLIVGCGNSGVDIACDAAPVAATTSLSMRRGYHFFPKHLFGKPTDVFAHGGPRLPLRVEQAVIGSIVRLVVGDLRNFGLPKPDHKVLESHPLMNVQVLHHLSHGDLVARADVRELRGEEVVFADGRSEPYDVVVWATGFEPDVPFLDLELSKLFLAQFHPERDDLSIMGRFEVDAGAFPILSLQGRLLVHALRAQTSPDGRAERWTALRRTSPDLSGGTKHVPSERHRISIQDAAYQRYVGKLLRGA